MNNKDLHIYYFYNYNFIVNYISKKQLRICK